VNPSRASAVLSAVPPINSTISPGNASATKKKKTVIAVIMMQSPSLRPTPRGPMPTRIVLAQSTLRCFGIAAMSPCRRFGIICVEPPSAPGLQRSYNGYPAPGARTWLPPRCSRGEHKRFLVKRRTRWRPIPASKATRRRWTVDWLAPSDFAAASVLPWRATARKWRQSFQSNIYQLCTFG
jgi:hypothetical protein